MLMTREGTNCPNYRMKKIPPPSPCSAVFIPITRVSDVMGGRLYTIQCTVYQSSPLPPFLAAVTAMAVLIVCAFSA